MSAPSAGPPVITPAVSGASERDRIITPYRAEVFEAELRKWGIWEAFSYLPTRLRCGFPIGDMEPLTRTFTPENHKGGKEHMDFIEEYVREQVGLGHMTGPYTRTQLEEILGGHFRSSPLSVVEKAGSAGKWRLIQNCSFPDEFGISVNDMIDSDDFPTEWGTASEVAEIVSIFLRKCDGTGDRDAGRVKPLGREKVRGHGFIRRWPWIAQCEWHRDSAELALKERSAMRSDNALRTGAYRANDRANTRS